MRGINHVAPSKPFVSGPLYEDVRRPNSLERPLLSDGDLRAAKGHTAVAGGVANEPRSRLGQDQAIAERALSGDTAAGTVSQFGPLVWRPNTVRGLYREMRLWVEADILGHSRRSPRELGLRRSITVNSLSQSPILEKKRPRLQNGGTLLEVS